MKEYYLCKLHNEVFDVAETRINTECFLPIREGVSVSVIAKFPLCGFPPYTGGCIAIFTAFILSVVVSSLYGRVYRFEKHRQCEYHCFLPVWEGISVYYQAMMAVNEFPPYTGGCIGTSN